MSNIDIKELFEAGAHFGHKTSRWHPKMAPYIHSTKGDQHIINLDRTVEQMARAIDMLETVSSKGKQTLFVGTKKQAKKAVRRAADATGMPYVNVRWMGGMLTNYKTMNDRVKHLKKLEERMASGDLKHHYNKLEVQRFQEEIDTLNLNFGGVKDLQGAPGAVVIVDINTESIAVKEAQKLGIPIIALVDSNANPTPIDVPIPANDDSIKAVDLIVGQLANAVNDGKSKVKKAAPVAKAPAAAKKPALQTKAEEKPAAKKPATKKPSPKKEAGAKKGDK